MKKYKATLEYTLNGKREVLDDTYTIDPDYFWGIDDIKSYIKHDLMLVAGGGYSTTGVKNAKFTLIAC